MYNAVITSLVLKEAEGSYSDKDKLMNTKDLIRDFVSVQKVKEQYSTIVTEVLTLLLNDFTLYLIKEGVEYLEDVTCDHLSSYFRNNLETYQYHLHETLNEFFDYLKGNPPFVVDESIKTVAPEGCNPPSIER